MDLEALKEKWANYHHQLSAQAEIPEGYLLELNRDRTKSAMRTPLRYEMVSFIFLAFFIAFVLLTGLFRLASLKFLIPTWISCSIALVWLWFSYEKIRLLSSVNYYGLPVITLQKKVALIKKRYLFYRRWEIALAPIFLLCATLGLGKAIRNVDLYQNPAFLFLLVGIVTVFGIFSFLIGYKFWYDQKISEAEALLKQVDYFEKPELSEEDLV